MMCALYLAALVFGALHAISFASLVPLTSWQLASSVSSSQWRNVSVPCTVMACLIQNGEFPDIFYGQNLEQVDVAQFNVSWIYRTSFPSLPLPSGGRAVLHFAGLNYRANVALNGFTLADNTTAVGPFVYFDFDITSMMGADNLLEVEVWPQYDDALPANSKTRDLGITFV